MIGKLRKHLFFIYFLSTGIILTAVIVVLLLSNIDTKKQAEKELFQSASSSFIYLIQYNKTIRHQTLSEFETAYTMLIQIKDNGAPLSYRGSWQPDTPREVLFEKLDAVLAIETDAAASLDFTSNTLEISHIVTVSGDNNDSYYGLTAYIPAGSFKYIETSFLYRIDSTSLYSWQQFIPYLLMELFGLITLFLLGNLIIKKALQPVDMSMKKQKDFIASASHELKSPLAVIQAAASAIELEPEKRADFLKSIEKESVRMSHLIQDMLFLASNDSTNFSMNKTNLEPDSLLVEAYEIFYPYCQKENRGFYLELTDEILPEITGDKERLMQMLSVFIDNAISYSSEGTDIILRLNKAEKNCIIEISDQGVGISDEEKPLVFDRFYRSDKSHTAKKHFGLGLSIARTIVKLHSGHIEIADTDGGGATFKIYLPFLSGKAGNISERT